MKVTAGCFTEQLYTGLGKSTNVASGGGSSSLDMRITKNSCFQRVDE